MRQPYLLIKSSDLAQALIQAQNVHDIAQLIVIADNLIRDSQQNADDGMDDNLPDDIRELKNKLDSALSESGQDDELNEDAKEHDVIKNESESNR